MKHFAYPNTREGRFIGCGRFAVFTAGEQPEAKYDVADPECPTRPDILDAVSMLAPEPPHPYHMVYEKKDQPEQHYIGNSLGLAYLLALISRTRTVQLPLVNTDIWCTGCIEMVGNQPILKAVTATGFEAKLLAFLASENPDRLFIVPESNLDQILHLQLNTTQNVSIISLSTFSPDTPIDRKIILKVRRNELLSLLNTLFEHFMQPYTDRASDMAETDVRPRNEDGLAVARQRPQDTRFISRQEALEELRLYGIVGNQIYLIDLIPLIEMLWADGQAQTGELMILSEFIPRHVEHINQIAGHPALTIEAARDFVNRFLEERPAPELLRALRSLIAPIRLSDADEVVNQVLRESLLAACLDIASSAVTEYPYRHQNRFNLEEKRCFFEILESLGT